MSNEFQWNLQKGDIVSLLTDDAEYHRAEIVGVDKHGTLAVKYYASKDSTRGKAPWTGGEVTDTIDHIKQDKIRMCRRLG
jgi:hypothetical protein